MSIGARTTARQLPTPVSYHMRVSVREQLLEIVRRECALELEWTGPDCAAEKYMAPLRPAMRARGHRAQEAVKVSWCAAFVWCCCREAGINVPVAPAGFHATMALVDAWRFWAKQEGIFTLLAPGWTAADIRIEPGDILTMQLNGDHGELDHIGFCLEPPADGLVATGEGNRKNRTAIGTRPLSAIDGVIRYS